MYLNVILYGLFSKRGVVVVPYYDHRPFEKLHIIPPEIRKMASEGEIDAVVATDIYPVHAQWLLNLEVPVASLMLKSPNRKIEVDILKLAEMVVDQAVKANRKTIGLINWPLNIHVKGRKDDVLRLAVKRLAALEGILVIYPKNSEPNYEMHAEQLGAELCEELLNAKVPPDLIFVYPDTLMRGVATTLIRHQVRVPEQVLVVSHRNAENIIFIPFPMIWLTVKIEDFAHAIIDQIEQQILGEEIVPKTIHFGIERSAPI